MFILQAEGIEHLEHLIVPDSIQKARFAEAVHNISNVDVREILTDLVQDGCWLVLKILLALLFFYVGKLMVRWTMRLMNGSFQRHHVDESLQSFLRSLVKTILYAIVILIVIQTLGINTSSFIALFASAGLAIGMALSGTLQNIAGGIVLLLLRPYRVGDYISSQGQSGTVASIGLFQTKIHTTDNRSIYVPNSAISSSIIDNYSQEELRRVDWSVEMSYGDDVDVVRQEIVAMLSADGRVLENPSPVVYVAEFGSNGIKLSIRAWTKNKDYWNLYFDINERIYKEMPSKGLHFPFPQMDVHVTSVQEK